MKKIIAKKDFTIDDETYLVGEEVVKNNDKEEEN